MSAEMYGLDPLLVGAVVWQESRANPWAIRYEPEFFKKYLENAVLEHYIPNMFLCTRGTERQARAFSWGLMQIMGQTAREYGFQGLLTELLQPEINLSVGCKILKTLLSQKQSVEEALDAYNRGPGTPFDPDYYYHKSVLKFRDGEEVKGITTKS